MKNKKIIIVKKIMLSQREYVQNKKAKFLHLENRLEISMFDLLKIYFIPI